MFVGDMTSLLYKAVQLTNRTRNVTNYCYKSNSPVMTPNISEKMYVNKVNNVICGLLGDYTASCGNYNNAITSITILVTHEKGCCYLKIINFVTETMQYA
jgi:hypothetical protein